MLGIKIYTFLKGELVGEDEFGNRYYRKKGTKGAAEEKRWVIFKGEEEASKVPAEWHGWLHHTFDVPNLQANHKPYPWQKAHLPNLSGTDLAYKPPGHVLGRNKRDPATGDYIPWKPS